MLQIRASMLPGWGDCPRRAAAKQYRADIERLGFALRQTMPTVGAAIGTAVHAGLHRLLEFKRDHGHVPEQTDAVDCALANFHTTVQEGVEWDETSRTPTIAVDQITRMTLAAKAIAETITPILMESPFQSTAGDDCELTGTVDLVGACQTVIDAKTGVIQRPHQAQLGAYALLLEDHGHTIIAAKIAYIKRTAVGKPQDPVSWQSYAVMTCKRAAWSVIQDIQERMQKFYATSNPWQIPANPMSMMCAGKFCPAHGTDFCELGTR
ncbi:MAG: PD-(D/E)XK nuclease family protein [Magnetococcales bacterium]|nr:PD-(D/E)XK nuclease family protein [Magnetococcales bacterium]